MTAFGLLLPTREAVMSQATPDFGRMYALAERAEALGFDSVWVGDSVLARPRFEPPPVELGLLVPAAEADHDGR